jgi:3-oxoacyl-[acyl-carrier protein] reductase
MRLENRRAVVTGGGSGIGRVIALRLAAEGAAVGVVDIDLKAALAVASEIEAAGGRAAAFALDVADTNAAADTMKAVAEKLDGLDILVNNAGVTRDNLLIRMSPADWDLVLNVNLKGAFNCTKAAVRPMMSARWGRIVNIASVIGQFGNIGQANYAASKAGLIALTKTTAREFASRNITANAIAPGFIQTPMTEKLSDKVREGLTDRIMLKRLGTPEDVANLVAFLVSDDADYITGQTINVDGGMAW